MKRLSISLTLSFLLIALPTHTVRAAQLPPNIHRSTIPGSIEMATLMSRGSPATADGVCPPTADSLFLYNFFSYVNVTNHGGIYDSSAGSTYDYSRRCQVSPITSILIRDNFGITEEPSSRYGSYNNTHRDISTSNCWEIARVSAYGQSVWSNKVCYTAPLIQPVSISGIYMYLNAEGQMDGDVYIRWTKGSDSAGLYWAACPPSDSWQPSNPSWTYDQTAFTSSGQTVISGHVSSGPRCKLVYAKNSNGILSASFRVEYTFARQMAQPHAASPSYVPPYSSSFSQNCVGICYGVPSKVNGLPRNTYVSGYFRKDGTYVRPYTRSK